ncbi:MAG: SGNH/GDSL hydrolase family protein [Methanobacteriota archaeon]
MNIIFFGDSLTKGRSGLSYVPLLQQQLPQHNIINQGKNGDTIASLYYRIKNMQLPDAIDIAFIWIGVNDILTCIKWPFSFIPKLLVFQPWAKSDEEFTHYYQKIIDLLHPHTKKIITVSPLYIGEDIHNQWNTRLQELSELIKILSESSPNIRYLDLRTRFQTERPSLPPISPYIPSSTALLLDEIIYHTPEKITRKGKQRGLYYTVDGVHLNKRGIQLAAQVFHEQITQLTPRS